MAILPPEPHVVIIRCVHDAPKHTCVRCAVAGAHHRARLRPSVAAALLGDTAAADLFGAALNDAARVHGDKPKTALLPANPKTTTPLGLAVGLSAKARAEKKKEDVGAKLARTMGMSAAALGYLHGMGKTIVPPPARDRCAPIYGTHHDEPYVDSPQMPPTRPVPNTAVVDGVKVRAAALLPDPVYDPDVPLGFELILPASCGGVPSETTLHFGGPDDGVHAPLFVTGLRFLGALGTDVQVKQIVWKHEKLIAGRPLPIDEPGFRHLTADDDGPMLLRPEETLAITVQNVTNMMVCLRGVVYTKPWKEARTLVPAHRQATRQATAEGTYDVKYGFQSATAQGLRIERHGVGVYHVHHSLTGPVTVGVHVPADNSIAISTNAETADSGLAVVKLGVAGSGFRTMADPDKRFRVTVVPHS